MAAVPGNGRLSPFLVAVGTSTAVVLAAPYIGEIRAAIQDAVPGHYRLVVGSTVAGAAIAAIGAALLRIRDRRWPRYLALIASVLVAVGYAQVSRTGNLDQDLVEYFHFVQYGLLTYLFYRTWRHRDDLASVVLPLAATVLVGLADEGLQWFIPSRVGELHDVLIDAVAGVCGIAFSLGVNPPAALSIPPDARSRRLLAGAVTVVVAASALFVDAVHLGFDVEVGGLRQFRSRWSAHGLRDAAALRVGRWPGSTRVDAAFAREDHYVSEGLWHVQRRNDAVSDGNLWTAWHENAILEEFYPAVLEAGRAWPPDQRARVAEAISSDRRPYASDAHPLPIFTVSRPLFWAAVAVVVAIVWTLAAVAGSLQATAGAPRRNRTEV